MGEKYPCFERKGRGDGVAGVTLCQGSQIEEVGGRGRPLRPFYLRAGAQSCMGCTFLAKSNVKTHALCRTVLDLSRFGAAPLIA